MKSIRRAQECDLVSKKIELVQYPKKIALRVFPECLSTISYYSLKETLYLEGVGGISRPNLPDSANKQNVTKMASKMENQADSIIVLVKEGFPSLARMFGNL